MTKDLNRKDLFEATRSHDHKHFDRHGIEIKFGSMEKDGTQSWVVISRGVGKCVTEFAVDHRKPSHCDEASSSTEKSVAIKQRTEQLRVPSFSSSALPIKQRNWKDFHFVPRVGDDCCCTTSKKMTIILRHSDDLREADGAIECCYPGYIAKTPDSNVEQCKYG